MRVTELNREQLTELKQSMLCDAVDEMGESPSWGDLFEADELISDERVFEEYSNTDFTEDDFFCSVEV